MKIITGKDGYAVKDSEGLFIIDGERSIVYTDEEIDIVGLVAKPCLKCVLMNFSLRTCDPFNDPDLQE